MPCYHTLIHRIYTILYYNTPYYITYPTIPRLALGIRTEAFRKDCLEQLGEEAARKAGEMGFAEAAGEVLTLESERDIEENIYIYIYVYVLKERERYIYIYTT